MLRRNATKQRITSIYQNPGNLDHCSRLRRFEILEAMAQPSQLPRMAKTRYTGPRNIFWTYTVAERSVGWLTPQFHSHFREVLFHTAHRHCLFIPVYCLMPDHLHWIGCGLSEGSDQKQASRFLRRYAAASLLPWKWQRQPYDHILRENESCGEAFARIVNYVLENPVRKGLVEAKEAWPYSGCLLPGYPETDWQAPEYLFRFWELYAREREKMR